MESKMNIYQRLFAAKKEIGKVVKSSSNPFFKSKYADLNALIDAVEPALNEHDLILLQPIIDGCVHTQIIDIATGQMISSWLQLPTIADPQKLIACITYYRRGTLQSLLSLQAIDDDGNHAAAQVKPAPVKDKTPMITDAQKKEIMGLLVKANISTEEKATIASKVSNNELTAHRADECISYLKK